MEIERKFLLKEIPGSLSDYQKKEIEQVYVCTAPVIRARKTDDHYTLTVKGSGMLAREELNLPMSAEAYEHLKAKADDHPITKTRYLIPLEGGLTGELDVFHGLLAGLSFMEIEFPSVEEALAYVPPAWVSEDVTENPKYHNSYLSKMEKWA